MFISICLEVFIKKENRKILIIDDEKVVCTTIEKLLTQKHFHIEYALSGNEAMALLAKETFDTILLDILLPGIKGDELIESIKKIAPKTKIIVLTGLLLNSNAINELLRKGASAHMTKPFEIKELLKAIG